jgi:multiple sugar transport system substrate-binding protein
VLQSFASPVYLEQTSAPINHQVFLDAPEYAHETILRGYEEWASVVGDGLLQVWNQKSHHETLGSNRTSSG